MPLDYIDIGAALDRIEVRMMGLQRSDELVDQDDDGGTPDVRSFGSRARSFSKNFGDEFVE